MRHLFTLCSLLITFSASSQTKKTVYIADRVMVCDKNDCMQVKEKKKATWHGINDTIIGLNYEEGYEYKAKVVVSESGNYSLLKLLSKKKTGYNPAVKLEGKKWLLRSMFDSNTSMNVGDTIIYITFDVANNRLTGHGICNNLKGGLKAEGRNISFSNLAYTKMKCADQGNIMEKIVTNLLEATDTFKLKGNQLILYSAKGSYMVFEKQ